MTLALVEKVTGCGFALLFEVIVYSRRDHFWNYSQGHFEKKNMSLKHPVPWYHEVETRTDVQTVCPVFETKGSSNSGVQGSIGRATECLLTYEDAADPIAFSENSLYPILVRGTTITTPALPPPPPPSPPPSPCHRHHHLPGSSVTDRLHLRRTEL
uniref:Uncharacterized protein n=1 Tax=Vespula pensylvanica TaxID=30213 RepID=A0A834UCD9_VESPE|nr:hypothetical protein H0235_006433 [Vespula pensylvanica]